MDEQLTFENLKKFSHEYNSNKENKLIEKLITKKGILKSCINHEIIEENKPIFNIELPDSSRYDQKENSKCWIYSGLNFIKYNISKNLNIDVKKVSLSNSYIAFFDKLEKTNNTYENIINLKNVSFNYISKEKVLLDSVSEAGNWIWFVKLVNKYGLVPYECMPDSYESLRDNETTKLLTEKVKKDCLKLINAKNNKKDIIELRNMKEKFLQENYIFLSKIFGEPKNCFSYEYNDINSNVINYENITPIDFKNKILSINLDDFIFLSNSPKHDRDFYKLYRKKYLGNIYKNSYIDFLNLPMNEIKELTLKQLKDKMPVYVGVNLMKFRDLKSGVLDTRLYNYKDMLGVEFLSKSEAFNLDNLKTHHCICICGVNLDENGKPERWKLEDTYGIEKKANGFYIMNDNYFDEYVLQIIINKKYLSKEQLNMLKQEAILIPVDESF